MASLRETEYDPFTGEISEWWFDGDKIIHKKTVDLTALVDQCKREANAFTDFRAKTKFHKVASLPPIVIEKIMKEHHLDVFSSDVSDKKKVEKIIELEYPFLKTHGSKLWRPTGA